MARLLRCAGLVEPSLPANTVSTNTSCTGLDKRAYSKVNPLQGTKIFQYCTHPANTYTFSLKAYSIKNIRE